MERGELIESRLGPQGRLHRRPVGALVGLGGLRSRLVATTHFVPGAVVIAIVVSAAGIALAGCRTDAPSDGSTTADEPTMTDESIAADAGPSTPPTENADIGPDLDPESDPLQPGGPAKRLVPRVHAEHPHDTEAFTQGLLLHDGQLYESTGLHGSSSLRRVDPASGEVLQRIDLEERYFGEGLALVGDRLIQLTWRAGEAFVYDLESFEPLDGFTYQGQGWGLCYDGARLVMTDGGSTLEFRDPETFEPIGEVEVTLDGAPMPNLNELECVGNRVWANVWLTDTIVEIDPESGMITSVVNAAPLKVAAAIEFPGLEVMNGIAHDPESGRFFVTGKLWPIIFEVDFVPAGSGDGSGG